MTLPYNGASHNCILCPIVSIRNVGAAISRPRGTIFGFAESPCEIVLYCRRATKGRPYIVHRTLPVNFCSLRRGRFSRPLRQQNKPEFDVLFRLRM